VFSSVAAGEAERRAARAGDDLIARPDVVMDRAFTVAAPPAEVWPWLGRDETFQVAAIEPESVLVYRSARGRVNVTWSITLLPVPSGEPIRTRLHLRLRLGPVRRKWLARTAGEFVDALTIAGMAAGLRERLDE